MKQLVDKVELIEDGTAALELVNTDFLKLLSPMLPMQCTVYGVRWLRHRKVWRLELEPQIPTKE